MPTNKNIKKQRTTRKKRGGEKGVRETFLQYLNNLKTSTEPCSIDENCKTPQSKSAQKISICEKAVFKGPKLGFSPSVNVNTDQNYIQVDPHTMNLLVQTAIKRLGNETIEQYNEICSARNNNYSYALKGDSYNLPLILRCTRDKVEACEADKINVNSVEDYIKMMNAELANLRNSSAEELDSKVNEIVDQIIGWIKSIVKSLDFLFEKIQFHHCDPKAAQLFLDGDQVIVGDLDKVTFSLNIKNKGRNTRYRVCLGGWKESTAAAARGSIPEKMRYETKPRATNNFEKSAFIVSILLLLDSSVRINVLTAMERETELKHLKELINFEVFSNKIKSNPNFKDRTSHKIASECVYSNSALLHSIFTISDGSQSTKNPLLLKK